MWSHSAVESLKVSSFRSRTRRGRCTPAGASRFDPLEERTLLSTVHPLLTCRT